MRLMAGIPIATILRILRVIGAIIEFVLEKVDPDHPALQSNMRR